MRRSGPRAFWLSFFLTLAILMPLLGAFVFYSAWQERASEPAARSQSGVPVQRPTSANDLTVLVAVAAEEPAFLLVRLNAIDAAVTLCPVPAESVLLGPGGTVLLADSYASAGPARAAQLLGGTLNITIDRYLAITPGSLGQVWGDLEDPRVNLTGLLEQSELESLGLSESPVLALAPEEATAFIATLDLPVAREARLRGAVWQAALRQQLEELPTALPAGLRSVSGSLLTDLSAADLYDLADTLTWLAKENAEVTAETVPGRYDKESRRYDFAQDSIAFATRLFPAAEGAEASPAPSASAAVSDPLEPEETVSPTTRP